MMQTSVCVLDTPPYSRCIAMAGTVEQVHFSIGKIAQAAGRKRAPYAPPGLATIGGHPTKIFVSFLTGVK
jgi:hypothetical protein